MTIRQESTGPIPACDGCGRIDANLGIEPYPVHDPTVGSGVLHHYCAGCAANRGLLPPVAMIPGWAATPLVTTEDEPATPHRSRR